MSLLIKLAKAVLHFETFPILDLSHNLSAATEVRNELHRNDQQFSRIHPFASWILTIAYLFSGSLTANLLLGEPVIAPFSNTRLLVLGTTIWYIVFFAPWDFGYKCATSSPVRLLTGILNEIYRVRKIGYGLTQAAKFFPNSWFIIIIIATIRSNGSGLMKLLIRHMQKTESPKDVGFMQLPLPTKISMIAAFLLILEKRYGFIGSYAPLQFGIMLIFVYVRLCSFFELNPLDILSVKNQLCIMYKKSFDGEREISTHADDAQNAEKDNLQKND